MTALVGSSVIARSVRGVVQALLCGGIAACSYVQVDVQPGARTVEPGGSAEFEVRVSRTGNIADVDLSTPPLPDTTAAFTPAQLDPAQSTARFTVASSGTAAIGPRSFEIQTVPQARSSRLDGRATMANVIVGPCGARWIVQSGTSGTDSAGVALDSNGDPYASVGLGRTALVAKLNANGGTDWYLPSPLRNASGNDVRGVVQPDGSIFFVGTVRQANELFVRVMKYGADRALLWRRDIGPATGVTFAADLLVTDLAVDPTGVTLVGTTTGDFGGRGGDSGRSNSDGWIAKLDPNGAVLRQVQTSTFPSEAFHEVVTNAAGVIVVRGTRGTGAAVVWRYDQNLAEVWARESLFDLVSARGALAISPNDEIYAALTGQNGIDFFALLMKLDLNNQLSWTAQIWRNEVDLPSAVAVVDATGEVMVLGDHATSNLTASGVRLTKVNAGNGAITGTRAIDLPGTFLANGLAVNGASDLYLAGVTDGDFGAANAGGFDAWIAKLDYARCWR